MIPVTRLFSLRGDCMLPLLEPGDEVWVRPGPVDGLPAGGLVAFARLSGPAPEVVVHRLVDAAAPATRADALREDDDEGSRAAFIGPVAGFRRGRRLVLFGSRRFRAYDAFARFWARRAVAPLLHSVLYPLADRGRTGLHAALRGALLLPPRTVFTALFGAP